MANEPTGGQHSAAEPPRAASGAPSRAVPARWRAGAPWALFALLVIGYYWFLISTGHFTSWQPATQFYDTQAEGFRAGHLHTTMKPDPRLLRLPNPLDYQHSPLWAWDYSLYRGRLYLYWGLTPAAALALVKALLGLRVAVEDSVLVFTFLCLRVLAGSLLLVELARRFTPAPPRWAVWAALLVFALAHPTPFLLARPAIYEAALAGGAAFVVCAYYFTFRWLGSAAAPARLHWLMAASTCLGLAGTTRPSLLPAGALFTVLLFARAAAQLWPERWGQLLRRSPSAGLPAPATREGESAARAGAPQGARQAWALARCGAAAFLPFSALTLVHLVINQLRFGSWREFGVSYQLGIPFDIGPRYVLANLYNYLFHPWHTSCRFPFLLPRWHETWPPQYHFPSWLSVPAGYYAFEPLTGVLNAIPFCWLLLLLPLGLLWARWRRRTLQIGREQRSVSRWFKTIVIAVTLVSSVPILMLFAFSMRYEAEFASGLLLLSCLAGWRWLALPESAVGRRLVHGAYATIAALTIVIAAPFGFVGYFDSFQRNNPALFSWLQDSLSTCPASQGGCPTMRGCGP